jgi:hypothetical protein
MTVVGRPPGSPGASGRDLGPSAARSPRPPAPVRPATPLRVVRGSPARRGSSRPAPRAGSATASVDGGGRQPGHLQGEVDGVLPDTAGGLQERLRACGRPWARRGDERLRHGAPLSRGPFEQRPCRRRCAPSPPGSRTSRDGPAPGRRSAAAVRPDPWWVRRGGRRSRRRGSSACVRRPAAARSLVPHSGPGVRGRCPGGRRVDIADLPSGDPPRERTAVPVAAQAIG